MKIGEAASHRFNANAIGEVVAERNGHLQVEWSEWPSQEDAFGKLTETTLHGVRLWHPRKFIQAAPAAPVAAH